MTTKSKSLANAAPSSGKLKNFLLSNGFYFLCIAVIVVFTCLNSTFFTLSNLYNILMSASFMFATTAGVAVVIIAGNMDLSVGSTALLSAGVMYTAYTLELPSILILVCGLVAGVLVGTLNGILISKLKFNSMVLTLGLQIGYRGIGLMLIGGTQVQLPDSFKAFGKISIFGGLYLVVIICLVIMLILDLILKRTRFGTYCYAIGCNEVAAKRVGIPIDKVKIATFMISGFCAALAGFVVVCRLDLAHSYIGKEMEFDAIEAAVIGGISLRGGKGNLFPGALFGVLLIYIINNGLSIIGASEYVYPFAQGIIVFVAMYLDALKNFKNK